MNLKELKAELKRKDDMIQEYSKQFQAIKYELEGVLCEFESLANYMPHAQAYKNSIQMAIDEIEKLEK